MTTGKKKRLSMLDSLASAGAPSPALTGSMMSSNRALRSARDAVDSHHVWELDPEHIADDRLSDRLDPRDILDLRDAIETNGQTVPVLVRRHPTEPDRYLLVYGRRRLEAIRSSDKVTKVRALVASLDDHSALQAQISENMARRDLSYIEKALFSQELISNDFGNQSQVAEVLTVTKSSISMALAIVEMVGPDLIRMIGPAHGIGRPKWEALGKTIEASGANRERLIKVAENVYTDASVATVIDDDHTEANDISVKAFEAVAKAIGANQKQKPTSKPASPTPSRSRPLSIAGQQGGTIKRTKTGVALNLEEGPFADWIELEAQHILNELHGRWLQRSED